MGICLRGRNDPPELTVDDVVDLAAYAESNKIDFGSIVIPAFYGPTSQPEVQLAWDTVNVGLGDSNPNEPLLIAGDANIPMVEVTADEFNINGNDLIKIISFLHEKFPDLKEYLEDTKEKEDEESIKSSVDDDGPY